MTSQCRDHCDLREATMTVSNSEHQCMNDSFSRLCSARMPILKPQATRKWSQLAWSETLTLTLTLNAMLAATSQTSTLVARLDFYKCVFLSVTWVFSLNVLPEVSFFVVSFWSVFPLVVFLVFFESLHWVGDLLGPLRVNTQHRASLINSTGIWSHCAWANHIKYISP